GRHPYVRAGVQADDGREDDVAGPDEQGEGHKAERQDVLAFQDVHLGEYHSAETGFVASQGTTAERARRSRIGDACVHTCTGDCSWRSDSRGFPWARGPFAPAFWLSRHP